MNNTEENKQRFFAQYWGQEVHAMKMSKKDIVTTIDEVSFRKDLSMDYLYLKPLSSITDEDAAYLAERFNVTVGTHFLDDYKSFEEYKGTFTNFSESKDDYCHCVEFFDYLRSKGYALIYMGLSVEKQVEYGWIKLTD